MRGIVIKGHLVDLCRVEIEEPVAAETREVDIIVRVAEPAPSAKDGDNVASFLRSLPPGTRSTADIDQRFREGRGSWG